MFSTFNSKDLNWNSGDYAVIKGWSSDNSSYSIRVTHYAGNTVWEFDMTGAKEAIANTCTN